MRIVIKIIGILVATFLIVALAFYIFSLLEPKSVTVVNEYPLFRDMIYIVLAVATLFTVILGGGAYVILKARVIEDKCADASYPWGR